MLVGVRMMNYENIVELLLMEFPRIKKEDAYDDDLLDLPHCVFGIVFVSYVVKLCKNRNDSILIKVGEFLERMALSEDVNVRNVLEVSVLESLVYDDDYNLIKGDLKHYLKELTLKEIQYWEKGRFNKGYVVISNDDN